MICASDGNATAVLGLDVHGPVRLDRYSSPALVLKVEFVRSHDGLGIELWSKIYNNQNLSVEVYVQRTRKRSKEGGGWEGLTYKGTPT